MFSVRANSFRMRLSKAATEFAVANDILKRTYHPARVTKAVSKYPFQVQEFGSNLFSDQSMKRMYPSGDSGPNPLCCPRLRVRILFSAIYCPRIAG